MSEAAIRTVKKQLELRGQEFAHIEDAVKAVMRVAVDQSIHGNFPIPIYQPLLSSKGRCLSIVPRNMKKEGYIDLEQDERVKGTLLYEFEASSSNVTHKALPPKQQ